MNWLLAGLWGAFVGLDATSFPQAMISRPLVAGTVAGLLLGEPLAGAITGVMLEIFAVSALPFGAVRTPEPGTAAVAATAAYGAVVAEPAAGIVPALLLIAVVFALGWEHAGGWSVHLLRRVNERVVPVDSRAAPLTTRAVGRRHTFAMLLDLIRGGLVTLVGTFLGAILLRVLGPPWPFGPELVLAVLGIAAAAVLASTVSIFGGLREHRISFGVGIASGILALILLR